MVNSFTKPTLAGYNSNPPPNDGTRSAPNLIDWDTHTDKIGDPLQVFSDAINDQVAGVFEDTISWADTITELKGITPADFPSNVMGVKYHTSLAGEGGGVFVFDATSTATDNNGTIIQPDAGSGRWLRRLQQPITVRDFGAIGDGVTDDTTALQAAIDMLDNGGFLYMPPGTYLTSAALNIVNRYSLTLFGDGAGWEVDENFSNTPSVIITSNTASHNLLNVQTTQTGALNKTSGITIKGIQFNDGGLARTCVQITSVNASTFENLTFQMTGASSRGIAMFCLDANIDTGSNEEAPDNQYNEFRNIGFRSIGATSICLLLDGNDGTPAANRADTSKCYFYNLHFSIRDGDAIDIEFADANTFYGVFIFRPQVSTGRALFLNGTDLNDDRFARKNVFIMFEPANAEIVAGAGTDTSSFDNYIFIHNGNVGASFTDVFDSVTVEVGASITLVDNTGEMRRLGYDNTLTPAIEGTTVVSGGTPDGVQTGIFTLNDGWCDFTLRVATIAPQTDTGSMIITAPELPLAVSSVASVPQIIGPILPGSVTYTGDGIMGLIENGTRKIDLYRYQTGNAKTKVPIDATVEFFVSGRYRYY